MKILIQSDGVHAHYYQRLSWVQALQSVGIQAQLWDNQAMSSFDIFDRLEPDIFLGQAYNLDKSLLKCIYERPHLKVGLRAGDWGSHDKEVDRSIYNILFGTQQEKELLKRLKEETGQPEFVHIHYDAEAVKCTHDQYETLGIKPISLMMCADTISYGGAQFSPALECDIGFVGGYWPYKGQVIDQYLLPLCYPLDKYKIKIFGNQPWGINQYCGLIDDSDVKHLFASAKICPNLSEPHAQRYGFDVNERMFKVLYCGGFCISDYVKSYEMFGDGIVMADSPSDFRDKIEHYVQHPDERAEISEKGQRYISENHTGFHRAAEIMNAFGLDGLANHILQQYKGGINVPA